MYKKFPVIFQVNAGPYWVETEEDAKKWSAARKLSWRSFLMARGKWNGDLNIYGGKLYRTVEPKLTVKVEVYDIRLFGELRFLGTENFKPGPQRIGWGLEAKVVAELRAGSYSVDWSSPYFGSLSETPETITVTAEQMIQWAQGVLNEWREKAEQDRLQNIRSIWRDWIHWGIEVPKEAPQPPEPVEVLAREDFQHMAGQIAGALFRNNWYPTDQKKEVEHLERVAKFFKLTVDEQLVLTALKEIGDQENPVHEGVPDYIWGICRPWEKK